MKIALKLSVASAAIYTGAVFLNKKYGDGHEDDDIIFEEPAIEGVRQIHFADGPRNGHDPGIPRRSTAIVLRLTGKILYHTGKELIRFADDLERPPHD